MDRTITAAMVQEDAGRARRGAAGGTSADTEPDGGLQARTGAHSLARLSLRTVARPVTPADPGAGQVAAVTARSMGRHLDPQEGQTVNEITHQQLGQPAAEPRIHFHQVDLGTWRATCSGDLVATIKHLDGPLFGRGVYQVTYHRLPSARPSQPHQTTRTVRATYSTVQERILRRGWF